MQKYVWVKRQNLFVLRKLELRGWISNIIWSFFTRTCHCKESTKCTKLLYSHLSWLLLNTHSAWNICCWSTLRVNKSVRVIVRSSYPDLSFVQCHNAVVCSIQTVTIPFSQVSMPWGDLLFLRKYTHSLCVSLSIEETEQLSAPSSCWNPVVSVSWTTERNIVHMKSLNGAFSLQAFPLFLHRMRQDSDTISDR